MKLKAVSLTGLSALLLAGSLIAPASADFPGRHPYYVHALGDLRYAHVLLDRGDYKPGVDGQEDAALDDISRAYNEIRRAGADDGKDINAHLVDPGIDRRGRLRRAVEALQAAHADVAREEDDPAAVGLRNRALMNIEHAILHARNAIRDNANY
jgi:hypothetical protein